MLSTTFGRGVLGLAASGLLLGGLGCPPAAPEGGAEDGSTAADPGSGPPPGNGSGDAPYGYGDDECGHDENGFEEEYFDFDQLRFSFLLTVLPQETDDDDSTGEPCGAEDGSACGDDDSADDGPADDGPSGADDDDSASAQDAPPASRHADLVAEFFFSYILSNVGQTSCVQRVQVLGTADFGDGVVSGCADCTGFLQFDPATAMDVSDPGLDWDDCDPGFLEENGISMGMALLQQAGSLPGHWAGFGDAEAVNFGDFLSIALLDAAGHEALGLDFAIGGMDMTAAGMGDFLADYGAAYTHAGLVDGSEGAGTLAGLSGIEQVSLPMPGTDWYGYFAIGGDPADEPQEGADMQGDYLGVVRFVIGF